MNAIRLLRYGGWLVACLVLCGVGIVPLARADNHAHWESVIANVPDTRLPEVLVGTGGTDIFYTVRKDNMQAVVHNRTMGKSYSEIIPGSLCVGTTCAYIIRDRGQSRVVYGEQEGMPYDAILDGSLRMEPSPRLRYFAAKEGKWFSVLQDPGGAIAIASIPFDEIRPGSCICSANQAHTAYVGRIGAQWTACLDGRVCPAYDALGSVVLSPDGRHIAFSASSEGGWCCVVDGRAGRSYDGIGPIAAAPDNQHFAYPARTGEQWMLINHGPARQAQAASGLTRVAASGVPMAEQAIGEPYAFISTPVFSPNSALIAHAVRQDDRWSIVINGRPDPWFDEVDTPVFSPANMPVYRARRGEKWTMVVGGKEGPWFDGLGTPRFAAGNTVIYPARDGVQWRLMVNGAAGMAYDTISDITLSPDGRHIAYTARQGEHWHVVRDGVAGRGFDQVGTPIFTMDNRHLLYAAKAGEKWAVMVDAQRGTEFPGLLRPTIYLDQINFYHFLATRPSAKSALTGDEGTEIVLVRARAE